MKVSLAELQAYGRLAVRGLGLPSAQAEAFCKALEHLGAAEVDWSEMEQVFAPVDCAANHDFRSDFRVLRDAPAALDIVLCRNQPVQLGDVDCIGLLQLYAREIEQAFSISIEVARTDDGVELIPTEGRPRNTIPPVRIELPAMCYERLTKLASRMYVPETDASRLAGAGAGLTDND